MSNDKVSPSQIAVSIPKLTLGSGFIYIEVIDVSIIPFTRAQTINYIAFGVINFYFYRILIQ